MSDSPRTPPPGAAPAAGPAPATGGTWNASWAAALQALELDVTRAEALLRAGTTPAAEVAAEAVADAGAWSPPEGLGPLPQDLGERAREILERQLRAAAALTTAMHESRCQLALTGRIESGGSGPRAYFIDQTG